MTMRKQLRIAALLLLLLLGACASVYVGAVVAGAESGPGRLLEATYPLWGWLYEALDWRWSAVQEMPGYWVLNEIMGRHKAGLAYRNGYGHFWGVGSAGTELVGLLEQDKPRPLAPRMVACSARSYEDCLTPLDRLRAEYDGVACRPAELSASDLKVTCRLEAGDSIEFIAAVMHGSCIHQAYHDGFNRKMIELLVKDNNWPPALDDRRLELTEVDAYYRKV